jgi:hypothetical protein
MCERIGIIIVVDLSFVRFHGIIVSLVTYGTEVGKSFEDFFFFFFFVGGF